MIQENYIIYKNGRKIAVQVPIKTYEKLVADSEELDEIKEYRKVKAHKGNAIPYPALNRISAKYVRNQPGLLILDEFLFYFFM